MQSSLEVTALSPFVARVVAQQPDTLQFDANGQVILPAIEAYLPLLQEALQRCNSEPEVAARVRQLRQYWFAQLAAADLRGELSLAETLARISTLADSFIHSIYHWLYPRFCERFGSPRNKADQLQHMFIIGMGKLGGRELNFSSDIDLIFAYGEQGETDHPRKSIDNSVFFTRLAQALIRQLDDVGVDGRVFRVDMRLRPFGQSGPLVVSMAALEYYYQEQGRDWERYAMVKARLIGASDDDVAAFHALLRPFVYRRYIDFSAIDALRKMKALINQEARRLGTRTNIKLGQGGIREIEFIAQVFQLIRGGQQRSLQTTSLYQAFSAIAELDLLPNPKVSELLAHYEFLRKLEHTLQQLNDEQTQRLPETAAEQQALALVFHTSWDNLVAQVERVMDAVHRAFNEVIGNETDSEEDSALQLLWQDLIDDDTALEVLLEQGLGKARAQQIWSSISELRKEAQRKGSGPRGRRALARLVPQLLEQIIPLEDAEIVLDRVFSIIQRIMSRTAYLELLNENRGACQQLIKFCRASAWLTEQIAIYPLLLDELIDPQQLHQLPATSAYPELLHAYLMRIPEHDLEAQMDALRQAKQTFQLKVAAADVSSLLPIMKVSDHLSYLAQALIAAVIDQAWLQVTDKYGTPPNRSRVDTGLAVLAYGKLGGIELGYNSDLDLVFLTDSDYRGTTNGAKAIEVQQFYLRFVQRILHLFTTRTMVGVLYDVDMRLRPSGKAGLLITRIESFAAYLAEEAWTWERQALVRARPVFGSQSLQQQLLELRRSELAKTKDINGLRQEVVAMREKMRAHQSQQHDIKHVPGGMIDVEFLVQFLVLAFAHEHPQLTEFTDNVRILEAAAKVELMSQQRAQELINAYLWFREWAHTQALNHKTQGLPELATKHCTIVKAAWQHWLTVTS